MAAVSHRIGAASVLLAVALAGCAGAPVTVSPPPAGTWDFGAGRDVTDGNSAPVEDGYYPDRGEPYLDTLHYGLDLAWTPSARRLSGTALITFRLTRTTPRIQLDLSDALKVDRATLNGKVVAAARDGAHHLSIDGAGVPTDVQHVLRVTYSGTPRTVPAPSQRPDQGSGLGLEVGEGNTLRTMQEPFGAHTWYPVNDQPSDKAVYDARLTAHEGQQGVFNGVLTQSRKAGSTTVSTFRLDKPAASYLTTLAYGNYRLERARLADGRPAFYWSSPAVASPMILAAVRQTPRMITWLQGLLGPYPFASVGTVVVPGESAMETQTMVTLGAQNRWDPDSLDATLVHEYAHQWLGDDVTPRSWEDLWLNEGMTTYVQTRYTVSRGLHSWPEAVADLTREDGRARTEAGPPGAYRKDMFASGTVYVCGALMMARLDDAYGERVRTGLRTWASSSRTGTVTREDFIRHFSAAVGVDLRPWVTNWLASPTTPTQAPPAA